MLLRRLWDGLLRAGRFLGRVQAGLLLALIYLLLLWPLGLLVRLKDPLRLGSGLPGWVPRPPAEPTLERFSHPF